ncbi:coniferyl-aldehyde dehydrogenase [Parafrankia irregularis]|uniref:Aldehyde dehydrogenase n=1 Tax=Parafrankia irregularis TaxID=795642 RepID=A0A0S4QHT4_9ACTN|nr:MULTISPECIES: aldehyde dehydrogenase family protein [Parafrankia]MBE3204071.1 aldehyde dehydrogenase family protein [Parafrankia sp. CH37]CUU55053.1 coniferyl-aldehyde dehydrogenase [Parafrankia irregularis]
MATSTARAERPPAVDASADLQTDILRRQRAAFLREGPPSVEVRLERIDRFVAAVLDHADDLVAALHADFGSRPESISLSSDIMSIVLALRVVRENLRDWMLDEEVPGSAARGTPTFIQARPKGVVGVIGPWNFPVTLVAVPAIEALAAGNRVMIKVSEIPSRTADVLAGALAARMHPDEVAVIRGDARTAAAFASLPFDHLIFTGSPEVGALVAEAAGRNLVPVTLELGGKNPVVLGGDADVALAAQRIAAGRLLNGGQVCLCPDYVFVPRARLDEFVAAYGSAVRQHFPSYLHDPQAVSLVNDRNFERVRALIDDAAARGARVVHIAAEGEQGTLPPGSLSDPGRRLIPPTVLLDVTPDMRVAQEEIFGPVIAVHGYDQLADALDHIAAHPSPLAAYWFGPDDQEFEEFLSHTTSGGVTRDDVLAHWGVDGAPSGGIGRSGMGAYTGKTGFDTFSHRRTVTTATASVGVAQGLLPPTAESRLPGMRALISQTHAAILSRLDD